MILETLPKTAPAEMAFPVKDDNSLAETNKGLLKEGGVRGVRKPQNRTEIRQKTANRIGFFPEYRNRAYM